MEGGNGWSMGTDGVGKEEGGDGWWLGWMGSGKMGLGTDGVGKDRECERIGWAGWRL